MAYGILDNTLFVHLDKIARLGAEEAAATDASGIYSSMLEIQRNFGYFLVFVPKSAQLMMAMASKIDLQLMRIDFWNYFVISVQSLQNIFLVAASALLWRRFHPNVQILIIAYLIVFVTMPLYGPRYLYPVTLWLIFALSDIRFIRLGEKQNNTQKVGSIERYESDDQRLAVLRFTKP